MSIIDFVQQFLATKPSLEWVGPDLYCFPDEIAPAAREAVEVVGSAHDLVTPWARFAVSGLSYLLPTATGVIVTSIGVVLLKKRRSWPDRESNENFEESIRASFKNQSDRTLSILEGLVERIPNDEPELLLFFTSEESNVTAMKLAMKMMRLVFIAKGEDKKLDELEQEHVVSGDWYKIYTISSHFLSELETALMQKTAIVVSDFQNVHPYSAALLTFRTRDLLSSASGVHTIIRIAMRMTRMTYVFLIINTGNACVNIAPDVSPEETAMTWWLTQKLGPYFRPDVLEGIQKELGERSCVIWKEPLSTIIAH